MERQPAVYGVRLSYLADSRFAREWWRGNLERDAARKAAMFTE